MCVAMMINCMQYGNKILLFENACHVRQLLDIGE